MTNKILFDYYMVGSSRDMEVYTRFPFYLDRAVFDDMVRSTLVLDNLVCRLTAGITAGEANFPFLSDDFPLKNEIYGLNLPLPPFFWTRYDAFQRAGGGIFFSEFNYDKPCAQREIAAAGLMNPHDDPNRDFVKLFQDGFKELCHRFFNRAENLTLAVLIDPGHYEELHLAQLYSDFLKPLGFRVIIAGGKNLCIEAGEVKVFGEKADIILRQFPTEFLHEIEVFAEILKLYEAGKVLLLNDPRSIIGQSKSIFVTLCEMADRNDPFLTADEIDVICKTLPCTKVFTLDMLGDLRADKDKYVIKAAFGRFSEEVYIGKMHEAEEWEETLKYVAESEKLHIVQDFCPIKRERVMRFIGNCYEDADAFGNFGVYLVNGNFAGVSLRFSDDYLSLDENVWISAAGIRDRSLDIIEPVLDDRKRLWNEINDEAAFTHGFTGGYTGRQESFSLQPLMLGNELFNELKTGTVKLASLFKKVTRYVQQNSRLICPLLGIGDSLESLVTQHMTDLSVFIGRMDWAMDSRGRLKLLEFNSETPAGLMESLVLNDIIRKRLKLSGTDPNAGMRKQIRDCFVSMINDYKRYKSIESIGLVSSSYSEDWYNTTVIYEIVKDLPFDIVMGEVSGLTASEGKLQLYGKPLDAVYRYYPLDWFGEDEYFSGVLQALGQETLSINPPSTLINQSKAFFALIYELRDNNFFDEGEKRLIEAYIPETRLAPSKAFDGLYCAKPYLGREGERVTFSFKPPFPGSSDEDCVYQEWVDIQTISLNLHTVNTSMEETAYPVIGTYLIGDDFGGVYTRAGSSITNKWAIYLPTYVKYR